MESQNEERRRETRYPIETKVIIRKDGGESIPATGGNISGGGMLLQVAQPTKFSVDEEITVDVELPDGPKYALSSWGLAKIVRIDGCHLAIQLAAGKFDSKN